MAVIAKEGVQWEEEGLRTLIWISDGDMRQALNNLQAVHSAFPLLDQAAVYRVCDVPNLEQLNRILDLALEGHLS